jgi:hypothetical protein
MKLGKEKIVHLIIRYIRSKQTDHPPRRIRGTIRENNSFSHKIHVFCAFIRVRTHVRKSQIQGLFKAMCQQIQGLLNTEEKKIRNQ